MYLDSLSPLKVQVGYGQLGLHGNLGYEDKRVMVRGQHYPHAISTHPPAHLCFQLAGQFNSFRCQVAINDDVQDGASHSDFVVCVGGRQVAVAYHIVADQPLRFLNNDISDTQSLKIFGSRDCLKNTETVQQL